MAEFHAKRCEKLRKILKRSKIDAALVTNFTNVTWFTGFTGDDSYLLLTPDEEFLLSDSRYTLQIQQECPQIQGVIRAGCGLLAMAKSILEERNFSSESRLAVEYDSVTLSTFEAICSVLTENVVSISGDIARFRMVKDKHEVAVLREAVRIARNAFHVMRASLSPDMTEKQIADEMEATMRRLGAKQAGFPTIAAVGAHAAMCHAVPGSLRVADADFLLVDWGAEYRGYTSDLTRVLVTGKVSNQFRKIYQIVLDAQRAAIDAIRPGMRCCEIDAVARNYIAKKGYGANFGHGLGHGIGLNIHENPSFSPRCEVVLEPGMVLTVEPGIYLEGWGGIRIEDDILVTRDGCEVLTSSVETELDAMIVD